jgi:hypothetical protein
MTGFWFNRMAEYWVVPREFDLAEHARRAQLQLVQAGTFGPMFYGLAHDQSIDRNWAGMPLLGVEENLAMMAELIPRIQAAGAKVVGQMSLGWHYGDDETGKGLFEVWDQIWTEELLGPAPDVPLAAALQRMADGSLRSWPIEGRPYRTYSGCICNPHWLAILRPMVKQAIGLGVDGFNAHHNFEQFCQCDYCRTYLTEVLAETFSAEELQQTLDEDGPPPAEYSKTLAVRPDAPQVLRERFERVCQRAVYRRRKEFFDALFIDYGRTLKPDLLLAQWYHKYHLDVWDERCLLPADQWARDEDYIWYSQGGNKNYSSIDNGYLADNGLPARYTYAMSNGKPMVLNKYDSKRLRLSIAEAGANHSAALAFHWWGDDRIKASGSDYTGPIERYQCFLAKHEPLIAAARPWSQVGLVYPRRAELEQEPGCLEPLKCLGRFMEDGHVLFDILLDIQLLEKGEDYQTLILPGIARLTRAEADFLRRFVAAGGTLVFTDGTGGLAEDGTPHENGLLADWHTDAPAGVHCLQDRDWSPASVELRPDTQVSLHPIAQQDAFGREFLALLDGLLEPAWLRTDAPWYVRVRAWRPEGSKALVLHWVNYRQDEDSNIEVPQPVGPVEIECAVPEGQRVERVEWLYPEKQYGVELPYEMRSGRVCFSVPSLIVYGLSVLHLAD